MKPGRYGLNQALALIRGAAAMRNAKALLAICLPVVLAWTTIHHRLGNGGFVFAETHTATAAITVDYPEDGAIFPPEITPPTFIWHEESDTAGAWASALSFRAGSKEIHSQPP